MNDLSEREIAEQVLRLRKEREALEGRKRVEKEQAVAWEVIRERKREGMERVMQAILAATDDHYEVVIERPPLPRQVFNEKAKTVATLHENPERPVALFRGIYPLMWDPAPTKPQFLCTFHGFAMDEDGQGGDANSGVRATQALLQLAAHPQPIAPFEAKGRLFCGRHERWHRFERTFKGFDPLALDPPVAPCACCPGGQGHQYKVKLDGPQVRVGPWTYLPGEAFDPVPGAERQIQVAVQSGWIEDRGEAT